MPKFCKYCGATLNGENKCAQCGKYQDETASTTAESAKQRGHKPALICTAAVVLVLIVSLVLGALVYYDTIKIGFVNDLFVAVGIKDAPAGLLQGGDDTSDDEGNRTTTTTGSTTTTGPTTTTTQGVSFPNADSYFHENSTVLSRIPLLENDTMRTERETYSDLTERGFTQYPITTEYSSEGYYYEEKEIYAYGTAKHPVYQTQYVTAAGDVWILTEISGVLMATPLSYNAQLTSGVPIVFSETASIMSYDSASRVFYENIPHDTVLTVKTVGRIDAQTLENLTFGAIDAL